MEKFCWKFLFWQIFFKNFACVFFKVKHSFGLFLGTVGPFDVKQEGTVLVGYWVYYIWPPPLTSLMTLTLDVSRSNFEIALRSCWSDWYEMKRKQINKILGWLYDLALLTTPSEFEIALSHNGTADWHGRKRMWGVHSWPWYIDFSVTMVGWVDVPDSDRGDFRCQRAVDIFSFPLLLSVFVHVSNLARMVKYVVPLSTPRVTGIMMVPIDWYNRITL